MVALDQEMGNRPPGRGIRHRRGPGWESVTARAAGVIRRVGAPSGTGGLVATPDPKHILAEDLADTLVGMASLDHAHGEQGPVGPREALDTAGGLLEGVGGPEMFPS